MWEFHNGIRRNLRFSDRSKPFMLDRAAWHELKLVVDEASTEDVSRRCACARIHARQPPGPGSQQRAAQSRSLSREQPGPSSSGRRQRRALGEDRHAPVISRTTSSVPSRSHVETRSSVLVRAVLVILAVPAFAQSPNTSTVIVLVIDQSGAVVKDASVSVTNNQTGAIA